MMGAVAAAVRRGGGHTLGVIPAHLIPFEVADTDADELAVVDTMRERKQIMDARSDAVLVLPGGLGTLEELFEMWTSASLGMHDKPVIVLDPDGFYAPLWAYLGTLARAGLRPPGGTGRAAPRADGRRRARPAPVARVHPVGRPEPCCWKSISRAFS